MSQLMEKIMDIRKLAFQIASIDAALLDASNLCSRSSILSLETADQLVIEQERLKALRRKLMQEILQSTADDLIAMKEGGRKQPTYLEKGFGIFPEKILKHLLGN